MVDSNPRQPDTWHEASFHTISAFLPWVLCLGGILLAGSALLFNSHAAVAAADQDWPAFILVCGLLLIGLAAEDSGLFAASGALLSQWTRHGVVLYLAAVLLVVAVTTVLNLDTAVTFLTPLLVYTARHSGRREDVYAAAVILLANAGSLLLPGANLTNLIALGHLHLAGWSFLRETALPGCTAILCTAAGIALFSSSSLAGVAGKVPDPPQRIGRLGIAAICLATLSVVVLPAPALPVLVIGSGACLLTRRTSGAFRQILAVVDLRIMTGLFGIAVFLGMIGREWTLPDVLLHHLGIAETVGLAAGLSLVVNNLPAASLLASRIPPHPVALLLGLNVGPNLFPTGSLAWILWYTALRSTGSRAILRRAVLLGAGTGVVSLVACTAALLAVHTG